MLFILSILFTAQASYSASNPSLKSNKLYVPDGYDTNDLVELTMTGTLPDTCHRVPSYSFNLNENTFLVTAELNYIDLPEGCRKMAIPFLKTINLGFLKSGNYEIKFQDQKISLVVKEAKGSLQDDYLYGNVTNIIEDVDSRVLKLIGTNPINCLSFEKLESEIQDNLIVLRPKFVEQGVCEEKPTSFSLDYEVPFLENKARGILIHVRVMGGRSLSHLFQNLASQK